MSFAVSLVTDRCPVIAVQGELDIATAPELERALEEAAADGLPVVVDLAETTFCDSTGMSTILRAHKRAEASGTVLVVVCPPSNGEVGRVIDLLGFDRVLRLHEERGTAIAAACDGDAA